MINAEAYQQWLAHDKQLSLRNAKWNKPPQWHCIIIKYKIILGFKNTKMFSHPNKYKK